MVDALESYSARFWRRFWKDATPWARDNILWGVIVLVVPPLLAYVRDSHAPLDLVLIKNSLVLYAFALAIYLLAHLCRTPRKLDLERDARETALVGEISGQNRAIKERDETIRTLSEPSALLLSNMITTKRRRRCNNSGKKL